MSLFCDTDTDADRLLKQARINLALLQRYAARMAEQPEGGIYLRLLADTAAHAVDYATAHCSPDPAPIPAGSGLPVAPDGSAALADASAGADPPPFGSPAGAGLIDRCAGWIADRWQPSVGFEA